MRNERLSDEEPFFVDHGTIHCRATGRHVTAEEAAGMLNVPSGATERIAWGVAAQVGAQLRVAGEEVQRMAAELRTLRAQQLTAEEQTDLAWVRGFVEASLGNIKAQSTLAYGIASRAIAILSRLAGGA